MDTKKAPKLVKLFAEIDRCGAVVVPSVTALREENSKLWVRIESGEAAAYKQGLSDGTALNRGVCVWTQSIDEFDEHFTGCGKLTDSPLWGFCQFCGGVTESQP